MQIEPLSVAFSRFQSLISRARYTALTKVVLLSSPVSLRSRYARDTIEQGSGVVLPQILICGPWSCSTSAEEISVRVGFAVIAVSLRSPALSLYAMTQKSRRSKYRSNQPFSKELAPQKRAIRQFLSERGNLANHGEIGDWLGKKADYEQYEFLSISDSDLLGLPCKQVVVPKSVFAAMREQDQQLFARLRAKRLAQQ